MIPAHLSIRIDADNPLHHLWRNHRTWWIHFTLNTADGRIRRVRQSLHTSDLDEAVKRRDRLFLELARGTEVAA